MAPTNQAAADTFCDYAVKVMQRYPYVKKVIIGNEPNQPKFWQPIWNGEPARVARRRWRSCSRAATTS